ncbi:MAG TPA: hypothetical protein V6D48_03375 [Oculatellaceae cyanobacterium]
MRKSCWVAAMLEMARDRSGGSEGRSVSALVWPTHYPIFLQNWNIAYRRKSAV